MLHACNEYFIHLAIFGDNQAGKSSLLLRFVEDNFNESVHLLEASSYRTIRSMKVKLSIKNAQLNKKQLPASYYKPLDGIVVMYDITNWETFENLLFIYTNIKLFCEDNTKLYLVGNKNDGKRAVSKEDGQCLARQLGIPFFEISSKNGCRVEELFSSLVSTVLDEKVPERTSHKNNKRSTATKIVKVCS